MLDAFSSSKTSHSNRSIGFFQLFSDPPMFIKRPESVSGDRDERVTLSCLVDANPQPSYQWYRTGSPSKLIGNTSNLSLIVSSNTVGEYICRASASIDLSESRSGGIGNLMVSSKPELTNDADAAEFLGHDEETMSVRASASVYMRERPQILSVNRSQAAEVGAVGHLVCEAISIPTVDSVEWFYSSGLPILANDGGRISVLENRSNLGVRSTLIVSGLTEDDFGEYSCRVTNSMGTDSAILTLQKQSKCPVYN